MKTENELLEAINGAAAQCTPMEMILLGVMVAKLLEVSATPKAAPSEPSQEPRQKGKEVAP